MTIYSLYIYDRHCECIFYHDWQRTKKPRAGSEEATLPGVTKTSNVAPEKLSLNTSTGVVVAAAEAATSNQQAANDSNSLPFDEEAKLVYGVVLSLRNMVKKLSGRDESFVNYRTSTYKLHLFETISGYKFIMFTDPAATADALKYVLRQIYTGPFMEFVVRNPLITMDSRTSGIDNEKFRTATDKMIRGLSIFA